MTFLLADIDADGWTKIIAAGGGQTVLVLGALTTLLIIVNRLKSRQESRDDHTDNRLDLWADFQLRRGRVEALQKGLMSAIPEGPAVPLTLRPDVRNAYDPVAPYLRRRYRKASEKSLSRVQFAEVIEHEFGPWMARHICAPLGISDGACLDIAIEVAMEPNPPGEPPGSEELGSLPPELSAKSTVRPPPNIGSDFHHESLPPDTAGKSGK